VHALQLRPACAGLVTLAVVLMAGGTPASASTGTREVVRSGVQLVAA